MSKTALITGASGGIGYELALLFARDGYDCILIARSQDKLKELAERLESQHRVKTLVLAKDLAKPSAVDARFKMRPARRSTIPLRNSFVNAVSAMTLTCSISSST